MTDNDPHEEGPVCDFCKIAVEPDETLEPIFVGEPKKPDPHYLKQVGGGSGYVNSRKEKKYNVLRKALHDCPKITLDESDTVHQVQTTDGESPFVTRSEMIESNGFPEYKTTITDDVAASLTIEPKEVTHTPDAKVCDVCAEMFTSLGDE